MHLREGIFLRLVFILKLCIDKFLAFKTFLDPRYDDRVPEENRWQLQMLLGYLSRAKVDTQRKQAMVCCVQPVVNAGRKRGEHKRKHKSCSSSMNALPTSL